MNNSYYDADEEERQLQLIGSSGGPESLPTLYLQRQWLETYEDEQHWQVDKPEKIKVIDGIIEWRLGGFLHQLDGPARISELGEEWWERGYLHRQDGPAVTSSNGTKEWWLNGKMHRIDGPAFIHADGIEEWWIDGKKLDKPLYKFNCF